MSTSTPASAPAPAATPVTPSTAQPTTQTSAPTSTPKGTPSVATTATQAVNAKSPTAEPSKGQEQPKVVPNKTATEVQEAIKKWKLKAGKQEREVTSEAELVRLAQLGIGANEKFEQAAKTRKQAEEVLEIIQKNPAEALTKLGFDVRKLAEEYLAEKIQEEMLTPEQKKVKEMEQQLKKYQEEKAEFERQQREAQISQLQSQYEVDIQQKIINAIDANKLPKNPKTVARFAEYMLEGVENGVDYDPRDLAPRIRRDLEEEHRQMYRDSAVEEILKILGPDTLKKIRQYELQKVKSKQTAPNPTKTEAVAQPQKPVEDKSKAKKKASDFFADLQKNMK
ncbi:unnamed protein product [Sphagnum balticum]